jgi:hypothetical protein
MPATRITPAQLFALAIIWSAVAYGATWDSEPKQVAHMQTARLVACR